MGATFLKNITYSTLCGEAKPGETAILRNPLVAKGELRQKMHLGCETMWDAFEINFKLNRQKNNFIGYRKKIDKNNIENKFTWMTYEEANTKLENFSKGLNIMKLCPEIKLKNEEPMRFLGIYSRNKPEWLIAYLGAIRDSITIVTIYDTLGDIALEHIFEQTQIITVVIEIKAMKKMLKLAEQNKTYKIKNLIVIDKEDDEESVKNLENLGFNVFAWEEIIENGEKNGKNIILKKPLPENISTINYTSGTTGKPKGAKINHKSIILNSDVIEMLGLYPKTSDVYLSFLPYAHIMETLILGVLLSRGVQIGIYNGNAHKLLEDFQILKPTATCVVPRIFQRIYEGINAKLNQRSPIIKKIFNRAIDIKIRDYNETGSLKNILFDNLFFNEVKKTFGGRVRFMLVGSAPMDSYLLNYLRCALSCEIVEGYGQTEDVAGVLLAKTYDPATQHLGGPGFSCELKLIDHPELDYTSKDIDKETGIPHPRGELCVRGPILFKGYLRDEEKTKESLDSDGWLHSGDICELLTEHGNALRIIDRAKNIFKLQQGEYIAPEKIENIYSGCKYVLQIFIYGDSLKSFLIAILVPQSEAVIGFFHKKGIKNVNNDNYQNYFNDSDLIKDIIEELDKFGRANDLKGFELPKKVYLYKESFSIENQLLTPTMKIRRNIAKEKFSNEIKQLYES